MVAAFATTMDVTVRWRPMSTTETATCAALLDDAATLILAEFPRAMLLDPNLTRMVSVNMVLRVLRNPTGAKSETVGPYALTFGSLMTGDLVLTAADRSLLTQPMVTARAPAGSIRIRAGLASPTLESDLATRADVEWGLIADAG